MATNKSRDHLLSADRFKDISFNPRRRGSEPIGRTICTCNQLASDQPEPANYPQLLDLNHPYYPFPYNLPHTDTSKCHGCRRSMSEDDEKKFSDYFHQMYIERCPSCHFRIRRDTCPEMKPVSFIKDHPKFRRPKKLSSSDHLNFTTNGNHAETENYSIGKEQLQSLRSQIAEVANTAFNAEQELLLTAERTHDELSANIKRLDHCIDDNFKMDDSLSRSPNVEQLLAERDSLLETVLSERAEIETIIRLQLKLLRDKVDRLGCHVNTVIGQCHATSGSLTQVVETDFGRITNQGDHDVAKISGLTMDLKENAIGRQRRNVHFLNTPGSLPNADEVDSEMNARKNDTTKNIEATLVSKEENVVRREPFNVQRSFQQSLESE